MSTQQTILVPSKIGPYCFRGTIGEGAFSVVKLAFHDNQKVFFACKIVPRNRLQSQDLEERFEMETRINQQMHHPGIVQIVDLMKDDLNYYIFMEFCPNSELFRFIVQRGKLPESEAKVLVYEILSALQYVHFLGVAHRDLKPENLLLDAAGHVKISDFGLSRFVGYGGLVVTPCGSPCYASPECLSGQPYNGRGSDMWSLGVIVYAMVTGQLPWTKRNQTQLFDQIRRGEYKIPDYLSPQCKDFIARMLTVDPTRRIGDAEALAHEWLAGSDNQISAPEQNYNLISLKKIDKFFESGDTDIKYNNEKFLNRICESQKDLDFQVAVRKITQKGGASSHKMMYHRMRSSSKVSSSIKNTTYSFPYTQSFPEANHGKTASMLTAGTSKMPKIVVPRASNARV